MTMGGFSTPSGGGGGIIPTGTGFEHITAGVQDPAAKLVVDADVDPAAAIAASKISGIPPINIPLSVFPAGSFAGAGPGFNIPLNGSGSVVIVGIESFAQLRIPAGTFKRLRADIFNNTLGGDSTLTLRVNGANKALAVTITAGVTGIFMDDVDTVSVVQGDLVNWQLVTGGIGIQSVGIQYIQCEFTST